MRSTTFRLGKGKRAPVRRQGGLSREGPESRRIAAYQELADHSPGVQFLAQLQARMDRPAGTSSAVVQRVEKIVVWGKSFSVEKAAKIAKEKLSEEDAAWENVEESQIEAALRDYTGSSSFATMEHFLALVKTLVTPPEGQDSDSDSDEGELFDVHAIRMAVRYKLGGENEEIEALYIKLLTDVVKRMNRGAVAVRWLTMTQKQKSEVLYRLVEAMVAVGRAQNDPAEFFKQNTTILHGSYLFGAKDKRPADIDLIIENSREGTMKISGALAREPEGDIKVGSKWGLIDYMVGIPFSETDPRDLTTQSATELREEAWHDLKVYYNLARDENNTGKKRRKFINLAVAIHYLLKRFDAEKATGLEDYIDAANAAITGGRMPNTNLLRGAIDRAMLELLAAKEKTATEPQ